ncbi:hypothetical protein BT63DRAFT_452642 [Microthyrium microscopicum]|uniref:Uncharacterized protein n=1 Tax=Microthyrium microscopicum TaxID=703497 RepID=A0A6A6UM43_9PEZI|nr:hypothetical protein BT63DRAFT_452642 [Microthyrium microscopicum]
MDGCWTPGTLDSARRSGFCLACRLPPAEAPSGQSKPIVRELQSLMQQLQALKVIDAKRRGQAQVFKMTFMAAQAEIRYLDSTQGAALFTSVRKCLLRLNQGQHTAGAFQPMTLFCTSVYKDFFLRLCWHVLKTEKTKKFRFLLPGLWTVCLFESLYNHAQALDLESKFVEDMDSVPHVLRQAFRHGDHNFMVLRLYSGPSKHTSRSTGHLCPSRSGILCSQRLSHETSWTPNAGHGSSSFLRHQVVLQELSWPGLPCRRGLVRIRVTQTPAAHAQEVPSSLKRKAYVRLCLVAVSELADLTPMRLRPGLFSQSALPVKDFRADGAVGCRIPAPNLLPSRIAGQGLQGEEGKQLRIPMPAERSYEVSLACLVCQLSHRRRPHSPYDKPANVHAAHPAPLFAIPIMEHWMSGFSMIWVAAPNDRTAKLR